MIPVVSRPPPILLRLLLPGALIMGALMGTAAAQDRGRGQERGPRVELNDGRGSSDRPQPDRHDRHDRREDHRELSDAVRRVERRTGGQVLSAERVPFDGRSVNRVKVVDSSGRVRVYMDDPKPSQRAPSEPPARRDDD